MATWQDYLKLMEGLSRTLEQLTGKTVKETYIYSFSLEAVIPLPI